MASVASGSSASPRLYRSPLAHDTSISRGRLAASLQSTSANNAIMLARNQIQPASTSSAKRGRKFKAMRAPTSDAPLSSSSSSASSSNSSTYASSINKTSTALRHPWGGHAVFDAHGKRTEIFALSNDRYPGAPGTALARAREAQAKADLAAKREAAKKLASKAELEHLGVKGLSKKRKSSSPYARVPPASSGAAATQSGKGRSTNSNSTARGRAVNAIDEASLPVPSGSARVRRPNSRSSSPVPLVNASTARRSARAGSGAVNEDASTSRAHARGASPDARAHAVGQPHGIAVSSAPFQSSPLASNVTSGTSNAVGGNANVPASSSTPVGGGHNPYHLGLGPSPTRPLKRKASTLSQEISLGADDTNEDSTAAAPAPNADEAPEEKRTKLQRRSSRETSPKTGLLAQSASKRHKSQSVSPRLSSIPLPSSLPNTRRAQHAPVVEALALEGLRPPASTSGGAGSEAEDDYDSDASTATTLTNGGTVVRRNGRRSTRVPKRLEGFQIHQAQGPAPAAGIEA